MKKLKSYVETFTPYNQIFIFEKHLCMSNVDFIFDIDQAQINSVPYPTLSLAQNKVYC
jgi:hypothetical protein